MPGSFPFPDCLVLETICTHCFSIFKPPASTYQLDSNIWTSNCEEESVDTERFSADEGLLKQLLSAT